MAAKSVVFDLDGTLWDSYPWYARLLARTGTLSQADALRRLRARESIVALMRECRLGLGAFRRACPELRLFNGAREGLDRLAKRGIPLGIVTSLPERLAGPMLEALEIADRFAAVRYVARKPHPGSLLDALRELGLKPDRSIIYVGDQATDAQAAQNAGIAFAWAEYGYGDGEPDGTDVVLRSAVDIARL